VTDATTHGDGLRGGLVFKVDGLRVFLRAELAVKLAPRPQIARLPGAPRSLLGLALSDGVILPVIELGVDQGSMIICVHRGEQLGLVGMENIVSGMFPAGEGAGVIVQGEAVPPLDLEEIYTGIHIATWGANWGA
jgi:hypothetical protein